MKLISHVQPVICRFLDHDITQLELNIGNNKVYKVETNWDNVGYAK